MVPQVLQLSVVGRNSVGDTMNRASVSQGGPLTKGELFTYDGVVLYRGGLMSLGLRVGFAGAFTVPP